MNQAHYIDSFKLNVPNQCLQFEYSTRWTRTLPDGNSCLLLDSLGNPWLQPNKDYVVFLKYVEESSNPNEVYFMVRPIWPESGTFLMFPVNNGIVYDPKNDFGFGQGLSVQQFINLLRQRISYIRNF